MREHQAKARLYVRVGAIFILAVGLGAFFIWGICGGGDHASPSPACSGSGTSAGWFMRRYVPSPGELPTLELEASKE